MNRFRHIASHLHALDDDSGVTLIELVIAAAILFVAASGVLTALAFAATSTAQTATRARALNLANQRLEQARNLPYDNVGVVYSDGSVGDPGGSIPASAAVDDLQVATEVSWTRDSGNGRSQYKNIKITVSWTRPIAGSVSVDTAIYGNSQLTNIGDLSVVVREKDTGNVIPGATVAVQPPEGAAVRLVSTDSAGEAFFGTLPIGSVGVTVTAFGWVFDPSELSSAAIGPDMLTAVVAYAIRPCTAPVTVIDTSGTPVPDATVTLTDSKGRSRTQVTQADGVATLVDLLPDTYTWTVTAPGRTRAKSPPSLGPMTAGGTYPLTVTMGPVVPPGALRVSTRDNNNILLSGVTVTLQGPVPDLTNVAGSPAVTPSSGEVFFSSVDGDTYTLTAAMSGYDTTSTTVVVLGNGVSQSVILKLYPHIPTFGNLHVYIHAATDSNSDPDHRVKFTVTGPNGYDSGELRTSKNTWDKTLTNLPTGTYTVTPAETPLAAKQVEVTSGTTAEVLW